MDDERLRRLQRHDRQRTDTFIDLTRTLDSLPQRSSRAEVAGDLAGAAARLFDTRAEVTLIDAEGHDIMSASGWSELRRRAQRAEQAASVALGLRPTAEHSAGVTVGGPVPGGPAAPTGEQAATDERRRRRRRADRTASQAHDGHPGRSPRHPRPGAARAGPRPRRRLPDQPGAPVRPPELGGVGALRAAHPARPRGQPRRAHRYGQPPPRQQVAGHPAQR
ncbi:MAG: hypothetical protein R2755_10405 [Acidimicrobiales bacterium]